MTSGGMAVETAELSQLARSLEAIAGAVEQIDTGTAFTTATGGLPSSDTAAVCTAGAASVADAVRTVAARIRAMSGIAAANTAGYDDAEATNADRFASTGSI